MRRIWEITLALTCLTQACVVSSPATVPTPTALVLVIPAAVSPEPSPLPPVPSAALPPPASPPAQGYLLRAEQIVDSYAIRLWGRPEDLIGYENILAIERFGLQPIHIPSASAIHPSTGSDLNNDGFPEAVIETYTGGAHCCFGTWVYSLRDLPLLILQKPESNAGGQFQDLDGDDIHEFITYDDSFAYRYCAYAVSPSVKAILAYDPSLQRYLPASPRFAAQYAEDIALHSQQASGDLSAFIGDDGTPKCGILPVILDYLYAGQTEKARQELLRLYPYPDVDDFWTQILSTVQSSPLYVAP